MCASVTLDLISLTRDKNSSSRRRFHFPRSKAMCFPNQTKPECRWQGVAWRLLVLLKCEWRLRKKAFVGFFDWLLDDSISTLEWFKIKNSLLSKTSTHKDFQKIVEISATKSSMKAELISKDFRLFLKLLTLNLLASPWYHRDRKSKTIFIKLWPFCRPSRKTQKTHLNPITPKKRHNNNSHFHPPENFIKIFPPPKFAWLASCRN